MYITTHCFFRYIHSINRHSERPLSVAERCKIGKEGEAVVCRGAIGCWAHLKVSLESEI